MVHRQNICHDAVRGVTGWGVTNGYASGMRVMVLGWLGGAVQLQTSRNMINFFRDVCINGRRGDDWLRLARSRSSENSIESLFCSDSGQRQRLDQRLRAFELNDL